MPLIDEPLRTLAQLVAAEKAETCGEHSRHSYVTAHQYRFAEMLRLCRSFVPSASARVLDVGRSELSSVLHSYYLNLSTLGLDTARDDGGHREVTAMDSVPHMTFDLLDAGEVTAWPDCEPFDLIVFSEVIEHLHVAPEFVLAALGSLLADRGVLICTTPNAAEVSKRVRLMFGSHPYERLRLYSNNPGHIREYTRPELEAIGDSIGLDCVEHRYVDWMASRNPIKATLARLLRVYPPFRSFQVHVFARAKER